MLNAKKPQTLPESKTYHLFISPDILATHLDLTTLTYDLEDKKHGIGLELQLDQSSILWQIGIYIKTPLEYSWKKHLVKIELISNSIKYVFVSYNAIFVLAFTLPQPKGGATALIWPPKQKIGVLIPKLLIFQRILKYVESSVNNDN